MSQGHGNAFMITESFFWPDRGASVQDQKDVAERTLKGFQHRQRYVDAGKAYWFSRVDNGISGVFILKGTFEELQEFFQTDPFYGVMQREVTPLYDSSKLATHFQQIGLNVDFGARVASPLVTGNLTIGNVSEALRSRLLNTDTNY